MASPSSYQDKFMLRLTTDGMRERLKAEAKRNSRSLNAEINMRLEASFAPAGRSGSKAQLGIEIDTSQIAAAHALVSRLGEAADKALDACRRLGIKIGEA